MPQDVTCPKCNHTFPVTEARQAFTASCPRCEAELTVEFKKPAQAPEAGEPPYQLAVKPGALPGTVAPAAPPPKRKKDDDEDEEPKRRGGSALIVLLSGGMGLLFVLGGLSVTGWYLFTQVDTTETTSNRSNTSSGSPKSNPAGPKSTPTSPKGGPKVNPGFVPGGGGDPFPPPPPPPPPKRDPMFDLRPVGGPIPQITSPDLPTDPSQVDLGAKVGQIAIGGGGRYLVMHFPDKGQLGIFDVSTAQVDFAAADSGNVHLTAGLSKAVIAAPNGIMRVYSLPDLKKQFDASSPGMQKLKGIAMGSRTNGPVVGVSERGEPVLFEVQANAIREVEEARKERAGLHRDHIRASPDGTSFATFDGFRPNQRTTLLTFESRQWKVQSDVGEVPFPGADGYFYGNGQVLDRFATDQRFGGVGAGSNNWFVPATTASPYFLKIVPGTLGTGVKAKKSIAVSVHSNRNAATPVAGTTPFQGVAEFDNLIESNGTRPAVAYDQHLFLIPEAKVLVTLTAAKTRLVLRKVDIR